MTYNDLDRGWAWMIVIGSAVINLSLLPIQQCYGLVYGDRFKKLKITATKSSLILHLNGTVSCCLGLFNGPIMKALNFRTAVFLGSSIVVVGIFLSAFATSLTLIIATHSVLVGIGHSIAFSASHLALNTYFKKKRKLAMGITVTLAALGPIIMPLLIDFLLSNYATTGTLIVLSGFATHSFIGASLMKPFKNTEINILNSNVERGTNNEEHVIKDHIDDEVRVEKSLCTKLSTYLELDLLKDHYYFMIIIGMGITIVAESNFNGMFPLIVEDLSGLERSLVAKVMSIQAIADILGRLGVPLLAQKIGWTSMSIYVISVLGSITGRMVLTTWSHNYNVLVLATVIVGASRGVRAVFQSLIIPDYVSLEKLPAAVGILMTCGGILSLCLGPTIGLVRDAAHNYVAALYFTSMLSMSCVLLWYFGGLWNPFGTSRQQKESKENPENR